MFKFIRKLFGPKKPVEQICKNCRLFNPVNSECGVVIVMEGRKVHLPVYPQDKCFFENEFIDKNNESFKADIQEIKMWVEDPITGQKSNKGIVKIELPDEEGDSLLDQS